MAFKTLLSATVAALIALPAFAGDMNIMIKDPYARSSAKSGAAFFTILNHSHEEDRLISASSGVSKRVELHTHLEDEYGVMRMRELKDGIIVPAQGSHALERGGDHVMFMGLNGVLPEGETISVTLTFEKAGDITLDIPVDNDRSPRKGHTGHGSMSHDKEHSGHATN